MNNFSKKQLVEDFDFLIKTVEEVHPNIYASVNEDEAKKRIEEIRSNLKDEMSIETFYKEIGKIVPSFKDGHTYISVYNSLQLDDFLFIPLSFSFNDKKAFIDFDYTNTFKINDEVISINDIEVKKMIPEMLLYLSAEKEIFQYTSLKRSFYILLSILFNINSPSLLSS